MSVKRDPSISRSGQYLTLGSAAVLLPFAYGHYTVPLAGWLMPVFLLRYTRAARGWHAWIPAGLVFFLGWLLQLWGMVPLPFTGILALGLACALLGLVPYAIDRWANRRAHGFASTLFFPCAVAGLDFALSSSNPYGSWCVSGYSQSGNLPIMQLASVTGLYGISFLVSWLGPAVNWAWERGFAWRSIRQGTMIFVSVVAGIYGLGSARLYLSAPPPGYQRVAGIAAGGYPTFPSRSAEDHFWNRQSLSAEEWTSVRAAMARRQDTLFALSQREVTAGARLVFWREGAAAVLRADEPALVARASAFTSRNHVYLGMALNTLDPGQAKPLQNKLCLIGPDGRLLFEYWKSRPVPGGEASCMQTNGNPMGYADTPLGRIGSLICFDLDFPSLVRQAGRAHVDLLIAPSNDWRAIDPWHTQMAAFRAVENGCNLVRNVSNGRSLAIDYLGRTLAETDFFNGSRAIVAEVPTRGVRTIYARVGDLFAWLCLGALAGLCFAVRRRISRDEPPGLTVGSDHR